MGTEGITAFGSVIYTDSFNSYLQIYDSVFRDNSYIFSIFSDNCKYIYMYNTVFKNNDCGLNVISVQSANTFIIDSCTFTNNKAYSIVNVPMSNLKIISSLFVDNDVKNIVIDSIVGEVLLIAMFLLEIIKIVEWLLNLKIIILSFSNNYFGTNNVSGKVIESIPTNNIKLNIGGESNVDYNNLTIAKDTHIFAYLSGNTDKLPVFNVTVAGNSKLN